MVKTIDIIVETMFPEMDLEGANYAGIPFIYAEYGFGQIDEVKYSISNIWDINRIVGNIL